MAEKGTNGSDDRRSRKRTSPFSRWWGGLKRGRIDPRKDLLPGILWGILAGAIIVSVAMAGGWDPFAGRRANEIARGDEVGEEPIQVAEGEIDPAAPGEVAVGIDLAGSDDQPVSPALSGTDVRPESTGTSQSPAGAATSPTAGVSPSATGSTAAGSTGATPIGPAVGSSATGSDGSGTRAPQATASAAPRRTDPALPVVSVDQMVWPVAGEVVRPFGWYRYPALGEWRYSTAVHLRPEAETAEVRAALAGRVKDVVNEGGVWRLAIEHSGGWTTEYEGLADVNVSSFQIVSTDQVIGWADRLSPAGVSFTVRQGGEAVDPTSLVGSREVEVTTDPTR